MMEPSQTPSILIVDDRRENLLALEGWLEDPDLKIVKATSGNEALGLMLEEDFALILLDVQMPEMDGFETAELMRLNEKTKNLPIIFVTAISKERKHVFKGYQAGAVDYLFKPLDPDILKAKVNVFIQLVRQKGILEKTSEELKRSSEALREANEQLKREIASRKVAEEAFKNLSLKDDLTGLYNRRGFFTLAEQELKSARRKGTELFLIFGDLDNIKEINDTLGHKEGDHALIETSRMLKENFRDSDIIARVGGDEFVILGIKSLETSTNHLINRFEKILHHHHLHRKGHYPLSMSLGIVFFNPQDPCSLDILLAQADKRMYENKQKKRRALPIIRPNLEKFRDEESRSGKKYDENQNESLAIRIFAQD
jgi:diguanylate cyclase (GGDEF)-like protein